ncbi:CDP-glycerol glycerophosphotransferase family protein [Psychrobacter sp. Ps2]|uniref:CDP-glycerol glycerophosphotransferase family protein n=1 Tax=Psychrobacter sp. Ps2 TaxID=2790956 RepID=UPI001EDE0780|nr:CDP-glycerol glycerophosphotransferase family protein [Psychrobacter sp. Ps2]MCG3858907.1 CDP-glycerol glycerophosphotransferase family protein [Psychrobacter sp. Ps2]
MKKIQKLVEIVDENIVNNLPIKEHDKKIYIRRLRKLRNDPIGFIDGSIRKRVPQIKSKIPIKHTGSNQFVVVSAVYNVESYIEEYFRSLVNQSLSFKKNITLILVDDGSTDNSKNIIRRWQKKYPKNIVYLSKSNGGASSARNYGLSYLKENHSSRVDYVTFIDPDDFVSNNYFSEIDTFLEQNSECRIVSCNMNYFYEESGLIKDNHPLKFRYNKTKVFNTENFGKNIILSSATTIYNVSMIQNLGIRFDERVKPSFEDCKFNIEILSMYPKVQVGFLKESIYYYRQREDSSSLMSTSWQNKGLFLDTLEYGVLSALALTKRNMGYVPNYVQNTALFHCIGYFRRLVNAENHADLLESFEIDKFKRLLAEIFSYIEEDTILSYNLPNMLTKNRIGLLGYYKSVRHPISYFYTNRINTYTNEISISFFTYFLNDSINFSINNIDTIPIEEKIVKYDFLGDSFFYERRLLLKYTELNDVLEIRVNGKLVNLTAFTKSVTGGDSVSNLVAYMKKRTVFENHKDSWVIVDRINKADDNAEHFYRFLKSNHPDQEIYFALDKNCEDWSRLDSEGFNLIDYGSDRFVNELRRCKYILSSHLFVWNFFIEHGLEALSQKKNIWLQHGVIANNNANVVNTKHIDLMVTSTHGEYHSIADNHTEYNLTSNQVLLSGLPRHDKLLRLNNDVKDDKTIFVMPTWRTWLKSENFIETKYFNEWTNFLSSLETEALLEKYDYKIVFVMHEEIKDFKCFFPNRSYIKYESLNDKGLQNMFATSKLMITDYSSVAFDMAFIQKLVIYYQFDRDRFFGEHYRGGYFSYEEDGFGPVVTTEKMLLNSLESALKSDCVPAEPYRSRMLDTFPFRDGKNCERIYESIISLDNPSDKINQGILTSFTQQAFEAEQWDLSVSRSQFFIDNASDEGNKWAENIWLESLFRINRFSEILEYIDSKAENEPMRKYYWQARIAFSVADWDKAISLLERINSSDVEILLIQLQCYAEKGEVDAFIRLKNEISTVMLSEVQLIVLEAWHLQVIKSWEELILFLETRIPTFRECELTVYKLEILLAQAYRKIKDYDQAHRNIVKFETHTRNNARCRIETALLAFSCKKYNECLYQYLKAVNDDLELLALPYALQLLEVSTNVDNRLKIRETVNKLLSIYPDCKEIKITHIEQLTKELKWTEVILAAETYGLVNDKAINYLLTLARYRLGCLDEAYKKASKPNNSDPYEYWNLISEISLLVEDVELAKYCYKGMISIYPNYSSSENWAKLNDLRNVI